MSDGSMICLRTSPMATCKEVCPMKILKLPDIGIRTTFHTRLFRASFPVSPKPSPFLGWINSPRIGSGLRFYVLVTWSAEAAQGSKALKGVANVKSKIIVALFLLLLFSQVLELYLCHPFQRGRVFFPGLSATLRCRASSLDRSAGRTPSRDIGRDRKRS